MASSKELNILIQAQLDKGNSVETAKGLGRDIASAIEEAFNGLGEKIAANLIMEMRGMLSNMKFKDLLGDDAQFTSYLKDKSAGKQVEGQTSLVSNNPQNSNQPQWWNSYYGMGGSGATTNSFNGNPISGGGAAGPSTGSSHTLNYGQSVGRFLHGNFGIGIQDRILMGISGPISSDLNNIRIAEMERTREDLRLFNSMKKIDPSLQMPEELKARTQSSLVSSKQEADKEYRNLQDLNQEIPALKSALIDVTNSLRLYDAAVKAVKDGTASPAQAALAQNGLALNAKIDPKTGKLISSEAYSATADVAKKVVEQLETRLDSAKTEKATGEGIIAGTKGFTEDAERSGIFSGTRGFLRNLGGKYGGGFGMAASAVGAGFGLAHEYENYGAAQEAARYRLETMGASAMLSGNSSETMAIQSLGGEDRLRADASSAAQKAINSNIAYGAGMFFTGAAVAGLSSATGFGAAIGGTAGAGMMGAGALQVGKGLFDAQYNQEMIDAEARKKIEIEKNRLGLFNAVGDAARARLIGSVSTAQSMGDINLTQSIYGSSLSPAKIGPKKPGDYAMPDVPGATISEFARAYTIPDSERTAQQRALLNTVVAGPDGGKETAAQRYERGIRRPSGTGLGALTYDEGNFYHQSLAKDAQSRFEKENEQLLKQQGWNYGENSSRAYASKVGLSEQQFDAFNQQLTTTIGSRGFFENQRSEAPYKRAMALHGLGYYNEAQVTSAYYNDRLSTSKTNGVYDPAQDSINALDKSSQIYADLLANGVEAKDAPGLIGTAAGRAASRGAGNIYNEEENLRTATAVSNQMYGPEGTNSRNIQENLNRYNTIQDYFKSDDEFSRRVGFNKLRMLNSMGVKGTNAEGKSVSFELNKFDEHFLRTKATDAESLQKFIKTTKHVDISLDDAKKMSDKWRNSTAEVLEKSMFGIPKEYRALYAADLAQANSLEQVNNGADFLKTLANNPNAAAGLTKGSADDVAKGANISGMANLGLTVKGGEEAGKTKAVTEGFEALTTQTVSLISKMKDLSSAISRLSEIKGADGNFMMGEVTLGNFFAKGLGPLNPNLILPAKPGQAK